MEGIANGSEKPQDLELGETNEDSQGNSLRRSKWDSNSESESEQPKPKKKKKSKQPALPQPIQGPQREFSKSPSPLLEPEDLPELEELTPEPITPPRPQEYYNHLLTPKLASCRHVDNFEKLNKISEGSYGVVYRARDRDTGEIVALKRLKLDKETNGFPVTSLRELHTLLVAKHPNIVNVREIVVGDSLNSIFIVMDFIEHDLKALMEDMKSPFLQSEIKTLMIQLLSAIALLHDNWIIHRDLKTSNLLLNNRGEIKVADFGLARKYGSPLGPMTQLVVTLWYRAPELLLGAKEYSTAIDIWSVGCIFGELINNEPLFPGRGEIEQLDKIFRLLGMPNEKIWPGFSNLPHAQNITFVNQPYNNLRNRFPYVTESGLDLLSKLLTYDPEKRITAEEALQHPYFKESPLPKDPSMFPTWPSKGAGERRRSCASPSAPQAAHGMENLDEEERGILNSILDYQGTESMGFRLRV
ncbi:Pkinase-domain-containing protein [Basidiobolus meristosporus CBS 931.73]|uniref:cyclin-dependent kinase n=1 Tax=Basidiobolus meristosporus CBS 931.73 TaxID=1314790 RepID=A0A1Y1XYQ1_9FUNG|nr:Pkinase-domain-containing protein [Basidiobolus meristosporus CBS 931.73]|eukprot:ORX90494.1 Pkinase-domain-containing protein [Basidiobolus meristosporus CBS 931.73]